jgi:hypothetical protein
MRSQTTHPDEKDMQTRHRRRLALFDFMFKRLGALIGWIAAGAAKTPVCNN